MPIGLSRSYSYGKNLRQSVRGSGSLSKDFTREEKIKDIRGTIKINQYLINYYKLLLDNHPENHLSFQSYLREIDKRAEVIKEERRRLIAQYNKASNGEIPSLQQQQIELEAKLKELKATEPVQRTMKRAKDLRQRLADLEQQLKDENFDVEELLNYL